MTWPTRIIIEGGEAHERAALASEIAALLESLDIHPLGIDGMVCVDDDERYDHLARSREHGVIIDRKENERP